MARSGSNIPDDVQRFVHDHVTSAAQIEVLLLMANSPSTDWSAAEITAELRSQHDLVAHALSDLHKLGLLVTAADAGSDSLSYRYQPTDAGLERAVSALATLYRERRHTVLDMIYSKHLYPRPDDSLQAFADAFRLRPKEEE